MLIIVVLTAILVGQTTIAQVAENAPNYSLTYQPNDFHFEFRTVMPGESLKQIARNYYGSEDITTLLIDNPFLKKRARFDTNGNTINYRIYAGDVLFVRVYDSGSSVALTEAVQPEPRIVNNYYNNYYYSEKTQDDANPWYWIGVIFLMLSGIAVWVLIGLHLRHPVTQTVVNNHYSQTPTAPTQQAPQATSTASPSQNMEIVILNLHKQKKK